MQTIQLASKINGTLKTRCRGDKVHDALDNRNYRISNVDAGMGMV